MPSLYLHITVSIDVCFNASLHNMSLTQENSNTLTSYEKNCIE